MKPLFITATNTNVGKTYTTLKLIDYFSKLGYKTGVFKPIETGVKDQPEDASLLLKTCTKYNNDFSIFSTDDICPIQFSLPAAPYVSANLKDIDLRAIFTTVKRLQQYCDILLIEGAGGLLVPIQKNYFMLDLFKALDASLLLVAHDKLGSINDTLLNLSVLKHHHIDPTWCINVRDPEQFAHVTLPFYKAYFENIYTLQENLPQIAASLITDSNGNRYTF